MCREEAGEVERLERLVVGMGARGLTQIVVRGERLYERGRSRLGRSFGQQSKDDERELTANDERYPLPWKRVEASRAENHGLLAIWIHCWEQANGLFVRARELVMRPSCRVLLLMYKHKSVSIA